MIRSLNLDAMFVPTVHPVIEFDLFKFSGGELHIKLNNNIDYGNVEKVVITNRVTSSDDLMEILFAVDALRYKGVKAFDLIMPYIPYARQDRKAVEGESFTLKVFAKTLNSVGFDNVYVLDSHSDVAVALIDNCVNIPNTDYVQQAILNIKTITRRELNIVSPDSGANKKVNKLYDTVKSFVKDVVKCDKIRNVNTGELSDFTVFADDLQGIDCLIVDDICDGGRTFVGVAQALKAKNCGKVFLFVSHGIFSYGYDNLLRYVDGIYTTNSFDDLKIPSDVPDGYVTQMKLYM